MLADPMNRYTYSVKKIQYFSNMYLITGCIKFTGPIINSSYTRSGLPLSSLSYVNSSFLPLPSVRLHLSSVLFMSVNFSFLPLPSVSLMTLNMLHSSITVKRLRSVFITSIACSSDFHPK